MHEVLHIVVNVLIYGCTTNRVSKRISTFVPATQLRYLALWRLIELLLASLHVLMTPTCFLAGGEYTVESQQKCIATVLVSRGFVFTEDFF